MAASVSQISPSPLAPLLQTPILQVPVLQVPVGLEGNGVEMTVLSALARLGKAPWAEAPRLADLSPAAAVDRLAGAILNLMRARLAHGGGQGRRSPPGRPAAGTRPSGRAGAADRRADPARRPADQVGSGRHRLRRSSGVYGACWPCAALIQSIFY